MRDRQIYFDYLEHLKREQVSMAHAGEILEEVFGISEKEAQIILNEWMVKRHKNNI